VENREHSSSLGADVLAGKSRFRKVADPAVTAAALAFRSRRHRKIWVISYDLLFIPVWWRVPIGSELPSGASAVGLNMSLEEARTVEDLVFIGLEGARCGRWE